MGVTLEEDIFAFRHGSNDFIHLTIFATRLIFAELYRLTTKSFEGTRIHGIGSSQHKDAVTVVKIAVPVNKK